MLWYSEESRRLDEEHEAAKAEVERLSSWYQEVKARCDAAPNARAKRNCQATLRIIRRAIRSAQRRRDTACEAVRHSRMADHAAYVETPQGKAWDIVLSLAELKRRQARQAAQQSQLQQEGQQALRRARFALLVKQYPLGRQRSDTADPGPESSDFIPGVLLVPPFVGPPRRAKGNPPPPLTSA